MKKMLSLLLAVVMSLSLATSAFAADFKDTIDIPQSDAVDVIETLGIVNGYGDNVYGPNDILDRAQLCTMLTRALYGDPIYVSHINFKDVPDMHWAKAYINTAYVNGLMVGYGDGMFGPEDDITYTQMAAVLLKALGYDCSKMTWSAGINAMGHSLGLFDGVKFTDYSAGCTRANAAQMIYNALDLSFVNHKGEYPVTIKNTSLLEDGLGFEEIIEVINGHWYVAYQDLSDLKEDPRVTNNRLTDETTIYPAGKNNYKLKDTYNAKTYDVDWYWNADNDGFENDVTLYVNGVEITDGSDTIFANCESATGVFYEDELVAIFVESDGDIWCPAAGVGTIPAYIYSDVIDDKNFDWETSTVTYFEESGEYVISNDIVHGKVTWHSSKEVRVHGVDYELGKGHGIDNGDWIVIYLTHDNLVAGFTADVINYNSTSIVYDTIDNEYHRDWCALKDNGAAANVVTSLTIFNPCDTCMPTEVEVITLLGTTNIIYPSEGTSGAGYGYNVTAKDALKNGDIDWYWLNGNTGTTYLVKDGVVVTENSEKLWAAAEAGVSVQKEGKTYIYID